MTRTSYPSRSRSHKVVLWSSPRQGSSVFLVSHRLQSASPHSFFCRQKWQQMPAGGRISFRILHKRDTRRQYQLVGLQGSPENAHCIFAHPPQPSFVGMSTMRGGYSKGKERRGIKSCTRQGVIERAPAQAVAAPLLHRQSPGFFVGHFVRGAEQLNPACSSNQECSAFESIMPGPFPIGWASAVASN